MAQARAGFGRGVPSGCRQTGSGTGGVSTNRGTDGSEVAALIRSSLISAALISKDPPASSPARGLRQLPKKKKKSSLRDSQKGETYVEGKMCHMMANVLQERPCHGRGNVLQERPCHGRGNVLHRKTVSREGKRTSQKDHVTGGETYFTERPCHGRKNVLHRKTVSREENVRHMEARSGKVHHGESVSKEGKRT